MNLEFQEKNDKQGSQLTNSDDPAVNQVESLNLAGPSAIKSFAEPTKLISQVGQTEEARPAEQPPASLGAVARQSSLYEVMEKEAAEEREAEMQLLA